MDDANKGKLNYPQFNSYKNYIFVVDCLLSIWLPLAYIQYKYFRLYTTFIMYN